MDQLKNLKIRLSVKFMVSELSFRMGFSGHM
jgi:hypothetical protein